MKYRREFVHLLAIVGLVTTGLASACGRSDVDVPEIRLPVRIVKDDLGREVKLPEKIERAISLAPSVTEMIFAAGAGDKLVGVTTYCNFPEEAERIEKIGDTQMPNIERIISLRPDIVFVSTASQLEAFMRTLDQQDVAVYVTDPKTIEEITSNLIKLGELFGTERKAELAAVTLSGRASYVRHQAQYDRSEPDVAAKRTPLKVFVQISNDPLFTIGQGSFLNQILEYAGGESVTGKVPTAFPKLSKETASAMNPEVIILSDSEDNREPNEVFRNTPAVKNGRVYRINADIISRPGPRLVDALEQIASFLHQ